MPLGRPLSPEVIELVKNFYHEDDVSLRPGMKKFLSRRNNEGVRVQLQKRLILGNLRELYRHFKDIHPHATVGFSSFAALRPEYCILAGASGTHTVRVCSIHQNFKLMILGNIVELLIDVDTHYE